MKPAVSVIIVVKDQASRLALTLVGLEQQERDAGAFEVIVVDDGSSDGGVERALGICGPLSYPLRTASSRSQGNRGIPRNRGAELARGELLVFLDADACPGRQCLAAHARRHAGERRLFALGECHVVAATATLLDPTDGTPFPNSVPSATLAPFVLPIARFREQGEDALRDHATQGIYPLTQRRQAALEQMLESNSRFAWAGVVPHNLSARRSAFLELEGFSEHLAHAEGWELGMRARARGHDLGWAASARSYHLFHARSIVQQGATAAHAFAQIAEAYPHDGMEAIALWWAAMGEQPLVPPELNLNNWRVVERLWAEPSGASELRRLYAMYRRATLQES